MVGVELLEEIVHVGGDAHFVVVLAPPVREARARGLVDVEQVGARVPGEVVQDGLVSQGVDRARPVLPEERDQGRAPGPSRHPHDHRIR